MMYREGCGRYDESLYKVVKHVLDYGTLPKSCKDKKLLEKCYFNLCFTKEKCAEINEKCFNEFASEFKGKVFLGTKNKWVRGMPIICSVNDKKIRVFRSQTFTVDCIQSNESGTWFNLTKRDDGKKFQIDFDYVDQHFSAAFCVTTHRFQGDEMEENFNIYEPERMDKRVFYTAISRGVTLNKVHLNYTKKNSSTGSTVANREKLINGPKILMRNT